MVGGGCSEPTDADSIDAVYLRAPGDYGQVADIPASVLLTPDADGRYEVRRGQQVTVVAAATPPAGATGFMLARVPERDAAPVGLEEAIPPAGTTYTFTVDDEETGPALVTFALTPARPGPEAGQGPGDAAATTVFRIESCRSGIPVPDPAENTGLVGDCESLLAMRGTLGGTGTLDWSAATPMAEWTGVTVGGTPPRPSRSRSRRGDPPNETLLAPQGSHGTWTGRL